MTGVGDVARWRDNLQGEVDGAAIYHAMARHERDGTVAAVFAKLAEAEERHGGIWEAKLRDANAWIGHPSPSWRARVLALISRFSTKSIAGTLVRAERQDEQSYTAQPDAGPALARDEHAHGRVLRQIATGGLPGPAIARLKGRHRDAAGNALRAAVLGLDDGLVSNFGLVMGVAGAGGDSRALVVAGFAGLLAGALSMALGEWLSVQSARELYARQIEIERQELAVAPDEEEDELALIFEAKGLSPENARTTAHDMIDTPSALDTLAREELSIDPSDLGGSAYVAAFTSFATFAVGAAIPLLPLVFLSDTAAVIGSAVVTGVTLFGAGALITVLTGRPPLHAGVRQLAIGAATAAITFAIGRLIGVAIG
jgi:VIT1/CCC1 family predicted Fe2+/Mn2+ transporter